jgi:cellulose synthase/poly-beta-1,6-N-acetylglucosamine synthase-like glycosyltransferase
VAKKHTPFCDALITLLHILFTGVALLLLAPAAIFCIEVLFSITSPKAVRRHRGVSERPPIAVLMPAHDEASVIANTLDSLGAELRMSDRLLVVADNCSDDTAALAARHGAEVIERFDSAQLGKGYAIDFGITHLSARPPDIVLIIDADCRIEAGSIDLLAERCSELGRPVQALYLMQTPARAGIMTRIAAFAWVVKNLVRPTALHRLGLPCQLMGSGMAFPWRCITRVDLATGDIVEDVLLGIALARAGMPALFCPAAIVTSVFPTSNEGFRSQRTRWEHGHLKVALSAPAVLAQGIATRNVPLIGLALDLCVPPLALLLLLASSFWTLTALFYFLTRIALPLDITSAAVLLLGLSVLLAWIRYGREVITLGELAFAVVYAVWKIPLYARFLIARQLQWVRSKRD